MTRKIISWLSFMAVFIFIVQSCVHDEIYSSTDPASKEYHSKSVFREDEKYIKNVMQVYFENETEIIKGNGTPLWDYAMTMGNFDESFLIVPVVDGKKVISCLQVPRDGDFINFRNDNDAEHIKFFQAYITTKQKRAVKQELLASTAKGLKECSFTAVSMWYPDSEQFPDGPGHWETQYITTCPDSGDGMSDGVCSGYYDANGNCVPGYPYPGGSGGNPNSQTPQDPCAKLKAKNATPDFKAKVNVLETNLTLKKETGYVEKMNGTYEYKDEASTNADSNSLTLGNPTADMKGYLHTHVNDFTDADGVERIGFKIFSPADVIYFNQMVALAQQNGKPLEDIYAVMVSGTGTYQIRFTGNVNQIKTVYTNTKEEYNDMYKKYFLANPKISNEMNFLKFIDEQMYVKGITLVKMNDDGTFTKKSLNADKTGVTNSNCPQ